MKFNTKSRYTLISAFSKNEYKNICRLKSANGILDPLKVNYEGNKDIKLRKVETLTCQYDYFTLMDGENVDDMYEII